MFRSDSKVSLFFFVLVVIHLVICCCFITHVWFMVEVMFCYGDERVEDEKCVCYGRSDLEG